MSHALDFLSFAEKWIDQAPSCRDDLPAHVPHPAESASGPELEWRLLPLSDKVQMSMGPPASALAESHKEAGSSTLGSELILPCADCPS